VADRRSIRSRPSRGKTQQAGADEGPIAVRIRMAEADLPELVYANHLVTQFTGNEMVLYAAVADAPIPRPGALSPPKELVAKTKVRLVMTPQTYLDHIIRSLQMIDGNNVLKAAYEEIRELRSRIEE